MSDQKKLDNVFVMCELGCMNAKTIIRKAKDKENPYAQIARSAAQDSTLSWKATGLLCYILSLPDDWQIRLSDLAKRKQDGIAATKSALKELLNNGYIEKISHRNEKGRFIKHECIIHESPITENHPLSRNPLSGFMDATNNTLNKEDSAPGKYKRKGGNGKLRESINDLRKDNYRHPNDIDNYIANQPGE